MKVLSYSSALVIALLTSESNGIQLTNICDSEVVHHYDLDCSPTKKSKKVVVVEEPAAPAAPCPDCDAIKKIVSKKDVDDKIDVAAIDAGKKTTHKIEKALKHAEDKKEMRADRDNTIDAIKKMGETTKAIEDKAESKDE